MSLYFVLSFFPFLKTFLSLYYNTYGTTSSNSINTIITAFGKSLLSSLISSLRNATNSMFSRYHPKNYFTLFLIIPLMKLEIKRF